MKRRPLLRMFLRNERARLRRDNDLQRVELIDQVLQDQDLFETVCNATTEEFDRDAQVSGAFGGDLMEFLKWIFKNRESLLQFIMLLISLFAQNGGADSAKRDI